LAPIALLMISIACGRLSADPLVDVQLAPPPPSPELRDQRNRVDVHYHLSAPGTLSSRIVSASGAQWVIHADAPRPVPGDYVLQFDGTVAGPGPNERRVLPNGDYQVVLEVQAGSQQGHAQVPLTIRDADTQSPDITQLALLPDRISP